MCPSFKFALGWLKLEPEDEGEGEGIGENADESERIRPVNPTDSMASTSLFTGGFVLTVAMRFEQSILAQAT